ncbi:phage major capsid protein [Peptostreptococcus porci]|uniref:phage major capsid protein n=1 Tax=Peptostreptococcus porci TaxID=2652282 RepID=UPI002A91A218|nr:phage major capsid protein [Peptostreptococcus porci]MDY5437134.1 phage major capsid protein [Peptostreptococcus porci]MDY6232826.1 phage major capsid protein [Peptostreptococcus porci]
MKNMKNLDFKNDEMNELFLNVAKAENEEDFVKAQIQVAEALQEKIISEAKNFALEENMTIEAMKARGLNILTNEETQFYNEVISKGGFDGLEKLMPVTVIDRIFKDIEAEHPLLAKIQFVNTTGITRWLARKSDAEGAVWGKIGEEIKKKLDNSFEIIDTTVNKLSAFIPISKDMLALGPVWIDKFVRVLLSESIAIGLEKAIITGTGVDQPVGMLKDITKPFESSTGYPDKEAVALKDLKPPTLGKSVMKPLVDNKVKTIDTVLLVTNPGDYWEKIFPQTTVMSADGHYQFNVLPINADIVQSAFVPSGKLIACIPNDYFMGIGFKEQVKFSDEYHFLEDERIYIQKLAGHGKPIENKSFLVFDISAMAVPAA